MVVAAPTPPAWFLLVVTTLLDFAIIHLQSNRQALM